MVFDAQERGRIRVVPIFVGPIGVLPPEMAELQGANTPDRPLVKMSRANVETTFAELVRWLKEHVPARVTSSAATSDHARLSLERIPAAGIVFETAEIRSQLAKFLQASPRRMCLVHGFPESARRRWPPLPWRVGGRSSSTFSG